MKTTLELAQELKIDELKAELARVRKTPITITADMARSLPVNIECQVWGDRLRVKNNAWFDMNKGKDAYGVIYNVELMPGREQILFTAMDTVITYESMCIAFDRMLENVKRDFILHALSRR